METAIIPWDRKKDGRVETGPVQFGPDDWPGMFIRGDDCMRMHCDIRTLQWAVKEKDFTMAAFALSSLDHALHGAPIPMLPELGEEATEPEQTSGPAPAVSGSAPAPSDPAQPDAGTQP